MSMKKLLASGLGILIVAFAGIQFVPVERTNPPVKQDLPAPPAVKAILKASCYDCHSNETIWPWYSRVAPVSWLLAADTNEGRDHLNFSIWNTYSPEQQAALVGEALRKAKKGSMPPWYYTLKHADGKLTPEKLAVLESWAAKYPGP
jgi:hypothetical protein